MERLFKPFDDALDAFVAQRRGLQDAPSDLLARLTAAVDFETGALLTPQEVRDEILTIFVAGHETTAVALTWAWFLLARHPEEEAKLHAELDTVLAGRTATQSDIPNLPYLRRFVDESLRLFPPAPGMSPRVALEDDVVGGEVLKKGTIVFAAPWLVQRHKNLWVDPEVFDPDRFLPEASGQRPRLSFMPFGAGPRICIGQTLAINEIVLLMATLAQHFRLELPHGHQVVLEHNITLRPKGGLPMRLTPRSLAIADGASLVGELTT